MVWGNNGKYFSRGKNMANDKPGFLQAIMSVLQSFMGVQSGKNLERDFQHGKPIHFIIAGLVLTLLFILVVWGVVTLVLSSAGV